MTLQEILSNKGRKVHSIAPGKTLQDVVNALIEHNCGSLVVCDGERMVGIITERDILRACAQLEAPLASVPVEARMTRNIITCSADADIETVMGLMTQHRIRHMPLVDNDRLIGLISIGDIVKSQHDRLCLENHYLKEYIQS